MQGCCGSGGTLPGQKKKKEIPKRFTSIHINVFKLKRSYFSSGLGRITRCKRLISCVREGYYKSLIIEFRRTDASHREKSICI